MSPMEFERQAGLAQADVIQTTCRPYCSSWLIARRTLPIAPTSLAFVHPHDGTTHDKNSLSIRPVDLQ